MIRLRLSFTIAAVAAVAAGAGTVLALRRAAARAARPRALSPAELPRLGATARQIAAEHGERAPASVVAVATTRAGALAAAVPGARLPRDAEKPSYLVVMRGRFTALCAPPGGHPAEGSCLSVVLDQTTLRVTDLDVSARGPVVPLERVGPVARLGG